MSHGTPVPTLTVATYNLLHGLHVAAAGELDLTASAAAIDALGADVVALQEVDRGLGRTAGVDQVAWLAATLGWSGVFAPALLGDPESSWVTAGPEDPGGPAYGIGLLSRVPVVEWSRHPLPGGGDGTRRAGASPSRPGWDREPRTALACTVSTSAGPLALVTTHLSYLPWRGTAQLRAAARCAGREQALLLGDLNLTARAIRLALPRWDLHRGPPTYPAWQPRVQIDHVLSRSVAVRDVRTAARSTSDHLPLLADVTWPSQT